MHWQRTKAIVLSNVLGSGGDIKTCIRVCRNYKSVNYCVNAG